MRKEAPVPCPQALILAVLPGKNGQKAKYGQCVGVGGKLKGCNTKF